MFDNFLFERARSLLLAPWLRAPRVIQPNKTNNINFNLKQIIFQKSDRKVKIVDETFGII